MASLEATTEARSEGLLALHINGCSGDLNPLPRRTVPLMTEYGEAMATAVATAAGLGPPTAATAAAEGELRPIGPGLQCKSRQIPTSERRSSRI